MTDYWLLDAESSEGIGRRTFNVSHIDNFVPLDDQFGIHPKRDWPRQLDDFLASSAGQNLFVLLDAAQGEDLIDRLAASGLEHVCLYQGDALRQLGPVAPWLVQLQPHNTFARLLLTEGRTPRSLWDRFTGLYLRSAADLAAVRKHLRKLMLLRDPARKAYYLRFWETGFIAELASRQDNAPEILRKLLGGRDATITALACRIGRDRFVVISPGGLDAGTAETVTYDLQLVMPVVRASAKSAAVDAISKGLWQAMPRQFAALGAGFDDLLALVERTATDAAILGIHGRAAIGKLAAAAAFTGFRPLHDPRLARFRERWLPVRPPRNDLAAVTRMIDEIQGWRQSTSLQGDLSRQILSVARAPYRNPFVIAVISGLSPAALAQWQDILKAEARRAGLVTRDAIAAHAAIAAICGPRFLQDPLQKRLASIFTSGGDIRAGLEAEARLRAGGRAEHAA